MGSNNAPQTKWVSHTMACGTKRQRLYVNGCETPYFIDSTDVSAHKSYGEKHGLWGAGMSDPSPWTGMRIAACFGAGPKIAPLKHRAEQMALSQ